MEEMTVYQITENGYEPIATFKDVDVNYATEYVYEFDETLFSTEPVGCMAEDVAVDFKERKE